MKPRRFASATCAVLLALALGSVHEARAATGIDPDALASPALKRLARIGVLVVGKEDHEAAAARALARRSLEAAGHAVVVLPTSPDVPAQISLLGLCASHDLDAVALVRISTAPVGWKVSVDIRDPGGASIVVRMDSADSSSPFGSPSSARTIVYAEFSFPMSAQAAPSQQSDGERQEAEPDDASGGPPRLWVSDKVTMLGPARIEGAEFYRLVGRPDLAASYEHNASMITTTKVLGVTSLSLGVAGFVLAAAAAGFSTGVCSGPNLASTFANKPASCGGDMSALFLIPLALTGTGGVLLASSWAMSEDPLSVDERRALARDYNARQASGEEPSATGPRRPPRLDLAVSGAPLAAGNGGMLLLGGRF